MMLAQGPFIYFVNSSMVGSVVLRTLEGEKLTVLHEICPNLYLVYY